MEILFGLGVLIAGFLLFRLINRMFDITYFGFKGLAVVFISCIIAALIIINFSIILIMNYYIWFIIAAVVIAAIAIIVKIKRNRAARQAGFTVPDEE